MSLNPGGYASYYFYTRFNTLPKEVLNFIFSIVTLDLENAVLIVDEPEIHLHPQWQTKLIDLYKKVANDRNLQFVISTHSPVFVNSDTIANIIRTYKPDGQTKIIPEEKTPHWKDELGREQDLIDIITYSNSAKMFFADLVILVEGQTDEIVFGYLLNRLNEERKNIEVVSVNGKDNFGKYITFLDKFRIKSAVICDLDNLWRGELLEGQKLLGPIKSKITEFVKNQDISSLEKYLKSSSITDKITNRTVGIKLLDIVKRILESKALARDDEDFLSHWLDKCIDKKKILEEINITEVYKDTDPSITSLDDIIAELNTSVSIGGVSFPVFVLSEGSIESYCDGVSHNIRGALKFLSELKSYFKENKNANPKFERLKDIVSEIVRSDYTRTTAIASNGSVLNLV